MGSWLVKTEPSTYGWDDLVSDNIGMWDGVKNREAQHHLKQMQLGDPVFVYHTGKAREIVGIASVIHTAYPDPTSSDAKRAAVNLVAVRALNRAVTLKELKSLREFSKSLVVRRPRLSIVPIDPPHFKRILQLGETDVDLAGPQSMIPPPR